MPENFEHFLKQQYWEKEEFRKAVEKSAQGRGVSKPAEKNPILFRKNPKRP